VNPFKMKNSKNMFWKIKVSKFKVILSIISKVWCPQVVIYGSVTYWFCVINNISMWNLKQRSGLSKNWFFCCIQNFWIDYRDSQPDGWLLIISFHGSTQQNIKRIGMCDSERFGNLDITNCLDGRWKRALYWYFYIYHAMF